MLIYKKSISTTSFYSYITLHTIYIIFSCYKTYWNFYNRIWYNSIKTFLKQYNVKYLIHTTRNIIDANTQELSGNLYSADLELHTEAKRFEVLDRIGGGDAFVAGIIHVLNKDINNLSDALSLGIDLGILKHLVSGDVLGLSGREINKWLNNSKKDVIR